MKISMPKIGLIATAAVVVFLPHMWPSALAGSPVQTEWGEIYAEKLVGFKACREQREEDLSTNSNTDQMAADVLFDLCNKAVIDRTKMRALERALK